MGAALTDESNIKLRSAIIKCCSIILRDCILCEVSDLFSVRSLTEKGIEIGPHNVESRDRNGFLINVVHYAGKCLKLTWLSCQGRKHCGLTLS